jgi:hypothetical protein
VEATGEPPVQVRLPLDGEAVLPQRLALGPQRHRLLFIRGDTEAPPQPEGITGELGEPPDRALGQPPEPNGFLAAEP